MRTGKALGILAGIVAGAFLASAYVIPVRLQIDIDPEKAFRYEEIAREDVEVCPSPLWRDGEKVDDFRFHKESYDGNEDVVITWGLLQERIHFQSQNVKTLKAVYEGDIKENAPFEKKRVNVTVGFADGHTEKAGLDDFTVFGDPETISRTESLWVGTSYGTVPLELAYSTPSSIDATYAATAYEGQIFDPANVKVTAEYPDGTSEDLEKSTCDGPKVFAGICEYTVFTTYGPVPLKVEPVPVRFATSKDPCYAGDTFAGDIVVTYTDGTETEIRAEDVSFTSGAELKEGENSLPFTWNGTSQILHVAAGNTNSVTKVMSESRDELKDSIYNVVSDTLYVAVRKIEDGRNYYLAHIAVNDPSQICVGSANGGYGLGLEQTSSAALRTGWILGINGSFYNTANGLPMTDCMIRNGQVLVNGVTSGNEICLTSSGELFSPPEGVTAQMLQSMGVRDVLATTDPLLIQDDSQYIEGSLDIAGRYPRTAIGMKKPGEYYIISADGDGLYYPEMQQIFADLGCQYARSLDGGNGVAMYYGSVPVTGSTSRPAADFLWFTK